MAETSTSRPLEILDWSGAGRFGDVLDFAAHAYALALLTGFRGLSLILVGPTLRPDIGLHEPGGVKLNCASSPCLNLEHGEIAEF